MCASETDRHLIYGPVHINMALKYDAKNLCVKKLSHKKQQLSSGDGVRGMNGECGRGKGWWWDSNRTAAVR